MSDFDISYKILSLLSVFLALLSFQSFVFLEESFSCIIYSSLSWYYFVFFYNYFCPLMVYFFFFWYDHMTLHYRSGMAGEPG